MTETELMKAIREDCDALGLNVFHAHDSRRSWGPGFPDLVIAGAGGILFREAKARAGVLQPAQRQWASVLTRAGGDWSVWRPRDLADGTVRMQLMELYAARV